MHRIDAPSATLDDKFTEGSPVGGVPATTVTAAWLNDVQENICAAIAAASIPLAKGRADDLLDAIVALIAMQFTGSNQSKVANGRQRLPAGILVQWGFFSAPGNISSDVSILFSTAFPNDVFAIFGFGAGNNATASPISVWRNSQGPGGGLTLGGATLRTNSILSASCFFIAVGH